MKYLLAACLIMLFLPVLSQESYNLSRLQGLRDKSGELQFEWSGYEILVTSVKGGISEKTINSVKKKYELTNTLAEFSENKLGINNIILETEAEIAPKSDVKISRICYLLRKTDKETTLILLQTLNQRDVLLEETFVKSYLKDHLEEYITDVWSTTSISFVGRAVEIGPGCRWMGPRNINCDGAQISWSTFPSFENANLDINTRIEANKYKGLKALSSEDVEVVFEGMPSLAHRVLYEKENGHMLTVYYVVQEVRGQYVSCVMSNSGYGLPSFFKNFMIIPELGTNEYFDEDDILMSEDDKGKEPFIEVRAGTKLPLGKLSDAYDAAPSLGVFIGIPITSNGMGIDLGIEAAFPVKRKDFDFYYHDDIYSAKADILGDVSLRLWYEQEVSKNVYWTTYGGGGYSMIQTNQEKGYDDEDKVKWHSVNTFSLFGGVRLRYKKVGCFLEYRYTPYSIANRVRKSFGSTLISTGISVTFK
ncbi:MAG: hypothetical protein E6767_03820 [Dysgonomonas sp.]|nr:hypothetical protein [Dysgonomonas sp.]